jgi:hypothetical protein
MCASALNPSCFTSKSQSGWSKGSGRRSKGIGGTAGGDITFSVVARQYACQAQPFATQWGTPVAPLWPQEVGMAKRSTTKRERLDTPTGSHFAKRDEQGRFKEMDAVGRSLSADRRTTAKRAVKSGHGDQGDRKR